MKKIILFTSFVMLSFFVKSQGLAKSIPYGTWNVFKYTWIGDESAFTTKQADGYINEKIIIKPKQAIVFGDTCNSITYKTPYRENTNDLSTDYNFLLKITTKTDSVVITDTNCNTDLIVKNDTTLEFIDWGYIIMVNKDTIVMPINGAAFYLDRVKLPIAKKGEEN